MKLRPFVIITVTISIVLTTLIVSSMQFNQVREMLEKSANQESLRLINTINEGVKEALWNFSPELSKPFLDSIVEDEQILEIVVLDQSDREFFSFKRDTTSESKTNSYESDVIYQNQNVGKIKLRYNYAETDHTIKIIRNQTYFNAIITTVLTIFILILLLTYRVLRPIEKLVQISKGLSTRALENPIDLKRNDEVGELANTLEDARLEIQKLVNDLKTQNDELEIKVQEKTAQLIQSNKLSALGEMAGGIAHEINNPLAVIKGRAQQAQRLVTKIKTKLDENDSRMLEDFLYKINVTADRIAKIVKGLRTFARDATRDPFEQVQIKQLIQDTIDMTTMRIEQNGILFNVKNDTDVTVQCRPVELSQVLVNLVQNSIDAVSENKTQAQIELEVKTENNNVCIYIRDNGYGVKQEVRAKIFDPFFTTKPVGKGTGLGLSVSIGIIRNHKGTLELTDNKIMTEFLIKLPISDSLVTNEVA